MNSPKIKLQRLQQLVGPQEEQWRPFLQDFAQELTQMQTQLASAQTNNNWPELTRLLHQLKSNLHLFGCQDSYHAAQDLEAFTQLEQPKMSLFQDSFQSFLKELKAIEKEALNWPK